MAEWIATGLALILGLAGCVGAVWYAIKKGWPVPNDGDEV